MGMMLAFIRMFTPIITLCSLDICVECFTHSFEDLIFHGYSIHTWKSAACLAEFQKVF